MAEWNMHPAQERALKDNRRYVLYSGARLHYDVYLRIMNPFYYLEHDLQLLSSTHILSEYNKWEAD